jgi:hypothetical protein
MKPVPLMVRSDPSPVIRGFREDSWVKCEFGNHIAIFYNLIIIGAKYTERAYDLRGYKGAFAIDLLGVHIVTSYTFQNPQD